MTHFCAHFPLVRNILHFRGFFTILIFYVPGKRQNRRRYENWKFPRLQLELIFNTCEEFIKSTMPLVLKNIDEMKILLHILLLDLQN